jgi:hypothetical protein
MSAARVELAIQAFDLVEKVYELRIDCNCSAIRFVVEVFGYLRVCERVRGIDGAPL